MFPLNEPTSIIVAAISAIGGALALPWLRPWFSYKETKFRDGNIAVREALFKMVEQGKTDLEELDKKLEEVRSELSKEVEKWRTLYYEMKDKMSEMRGENNQLRSESNQLKAELALLRQQFEARKEESDACHRAVPKPE